MIVILHNNDAFATLMMNEQLIKKNHINGQLLT